MSRRSRSCIDDSAAGTQLEKLAKLKRSRDNDAVEAGLVV
jgi:hypothetical protein